MHRVWLFIVLFILSPLALAKVTDLASLQQQLASQSLVRGDFSQQRHIAMFEQPLASSGQFLLAKEHGLLWHQTSPFPVSLVLTEDKLRQTFANQPAQIVTKQQNPMAFYFSHIFLSVFHGDTEQLKQQFELDFSLQGEQWQLTLVPLSAPLNSVFKQIMLSGQQDINRLVLEELRGDKTEIIFSNQRHQPETLTNEEQQQFAF